MPKKKKNSNTKKLKESTRKKRRTISKIPIWFKHYTNKANPLTYLSLTESAIAANYKAGSRQRFKDIGYQNSLKLSKEIAQFIEDNEVSGAALIKKHQELLHAKETKFFQKDGVVVETREVEAYGVQIKALDMAYKKTGDYAPEKKEHSFDGPMMEFIAEQKHKDKHGTSSPKNN